MSVTVQECNLRESPICPHGPTILFSRGTEDRKFFACAACRDRKDCNFFLWEDELATIPDTTKTVWKTQRDQYVKINRAKKISILEQIKKLPVSDRMYCMTCNKFVLPENDKHVKHQLKIGVSDQDLKNPSYMLLPLDNAKKEAQYLFSSTAVETIVGILSELSIRNVLCVGSPRIHEYIQNKKRDMQSLLLDFDKRYHNFYTKTSFCWYNAFNHHFFLPSSKKTFKEFLKNGTGDFALVTDPPFGGRIELLAKTFNHINTLYKRLHDTKEELKVMWIFPYFMEPQILNSLPNFEMLDYKVNYDNHVLFKQGPKGRKQGSPVRIFTNIKASLITLPVEQGYKYCSKCKKFVAIENKHCNKCKNCTSKDGRTYIHCEICERCVKPTWNHCDTCQRCAQPDHSCENLRFEQKCFHCQKPGHKKRDCPEVDQEVLKAKRRRLC